MSLRDEEGLSISNLNALDVLLVFLDEILGFLV